MENLGARLLARFGLGGELEHGMDFSKRGRWPHHGDERSLLVEILAQPDDDDVDELRITDDVTKFP